MSKKLPARSATAPPPAGRSPAADAGDLPQHVGQTDSIGCLRQLVVPCYPAGISANSRWSSAANTTGRSAVLVSVSRRDSSRCGSRNRCNPSGIGLPRAACCPVVSLRSPPAIGWHPFGIGARIQPRVETTIWRMHSRRSSLVSGPALAAGSPDRALTRTGG